MRAQKQRTSAVLIFTLIYATILTDYQLNAVVFNPNCFDYTVTTYQSQVDDNFGITTMMKLKPNSLCEFYVYTGIARMIYPSDLQVSFYKLNSVGAWLSLGTVRNGDTLQWYGLNGQADRRRFIVNNPTQFGVSFRINVQVYTGLKLNAINQLYSTWSAILIGLAVVGGMFL